MGRLDIEPLSERQWSRIERELFDRVEERVANLTPHALEEHGGPRATRTAVALMLVGAAAAMGGAVTWHVFSAPRQGGAADPSRITTDAAASHVKVGEATLEVAPRSTVAVFGDDARGVTVMLERGRVECDVPPRGDRPPFAVQAGDVAVRVVGTHFAVTRSAADVEVDVQRGVVEVVEGSRRIDVHAGEAWPLRARLASSAPAAGASPLPMPAPTDAARESVLPGPTAVVAPLASPAVVGLPSARERFESASRLEASHPDAAISIYKELANKGGPWGMNALFAQGRLEADRGHVAEAHRLLSEYLARYPAGPNADDAQQLDQRLR